MISISHPRMSLTDLPKKYKMRMTKFSQLYIIHIEIAKNVDGTPVKYEFNYKKINIFFILH